MKTLASNKRATFDFEITDKLIAGLVLTGSEVKSIKHGHISLKGSYVRFVNGEPVLTAAHVSPYAPAYVQHEPERDRKLLLHKAEIKRLVAAKQNGLHILPLKVGSQKGLIKIEIGIGKSKKKRDKRQSIKQRQMQREMQRAIKR